MPPFQLLLRLFDSIIPARAKPRRRVHLIRINRPQRQKKVPTNNPLLKALWVTIREEYFPNQPELDTYAVYWSGRRQKRVLACCHIERKEVRVARELEAEDLSQWLAPILYHEMCHAALGLTIKRGKGKVPWHGAEFKKLVKKHPGTAPMESWIKGGGWATAVRRDRGRRAAVTRSRRL